MQIVFVCVFVCAPSQPRQIGGVAVLLAAKYVYQRLWKLWQKKKTKGTRSAVCVSRFSGWLATRYLTALLQRCAPNCCCHLCWGDQLLLLLLLMLLMKSNWRPFVMLMRFKRLSKLKLGLQQQQQLKHRTLNSSCCEWTSEWVSVST